MARRNGCRLTQNRLNSSERGQYAVAKKVFSCEGLRFGMVSLEPRRLEDLPRRLSVVSGAGPAASLLLAIAVELYVFIADPPLVPAFAWHVLAGSSFLLGVAELLPDAGRGNVSDGERILMLLRDDAAAQRWVSTLYSESRLMRGEQPEAGIEAAIAKAAGLDDDSRDAVSA